MAVDKHEIPTIISRDHWGALSPKIYPKLQILETPVPYIVVSYFTPWVTDDKLALQLIQQKHMDAGLPDIQSNFLVGHDGKVYTGRGWKIKPAKSLDFPSYDGKFIEISYIGNFNNETVTHPIFKATWDLIDYGKKKNYISEDFRILTEKDKDRRIAS